MRGKGLLDHENVFICKDDAHGFQYLGVQFVIRLECHMHLCEIFVPEFCHDLWGDANVNLVPRKAYLFQSAIATVGLVVDFKILRGVFKFDRAREHKHRWLIGVCLRVGKQHVDGD